MYFTALLCWCWPVYSVCPSSVIINYPARMITQEMLALYLQIRQELNGIGSLFDSPIKILVDKFLSILASDGGVKECTENDLVNLLSILFRIVDCSSGTGMRGQSQHLLEFC